MTESELSSPDGPQRGSASRLRLRGDGDRGCRHCGEVALVYDPATGVARCRVCGESD